MLLENRPPRFRVGAAVDEEIGMQGVIARKEVLLHGVTIFRLWGARCYLPCLRAAMSRSPSTFLEIVASSTVR